MLWLVGSIDVEVEGACDLSSEVKIIHMIPYIDIGIFGGGLDYVPNKSKYL